MLGVSEGVRCVADMNAAIELFIDVSGMWCVSWEVPKVGFWERHGKSRGGD
jgi:hypothetical protein